MPCLPHSLSATFGSVCNTIDACSGGDASVATIFKHRERSLPLPDGSARQAVRNGEKGKVEKTMRVTFINLWPRGGMLHYSCHLANALADCDNTDVTIVLPRESDTRYLSPKLRSCFVEAPVRDGLSQLPRNLWMFSKIQCFLRVVRETHPEVIHVNSSHLWLVGTLPYLCRRYPLVATVHEIRPHPGEDTFRKRIERRAPLLHASCLAVHSEHLRKCLLATWPSRRPEDVIVTPHGAYRFAEDDSLGNNAKIPTVLFFGRILRYKGLEYLAAAAPRVREQVPDVRFIIAGEGNLGPYPRLKSDPTLFEIRNTFVPDDDVTDYFRRAWLLVLPYTEASWTGVAGIAQDSALPVVATRVGCLPEAVQDGNDGIIVPPRDAVSLADAIIRLLKDGELRRRYGCAGRARAQKGWSEAAQTLRKAYTEIVRQQGF